MIKFLLGESISPETAHLLCELGYDAIHVNQTNLRGHFDEEIISYAEKDERIIITFDRDFGEIWYYTSEIKVGIIVLKIKPQTVENANNVLSKFLKSNAIEKKKLQKSLIILEAHKYRYREKFTRTP